MRVDEFFDNNIFSSDSEIYLENISSTSEIGTFQHEENDEIDNSPTGYTHSRNSRDNMVRKVKSTFCRHIINLLNTTARVNTVKKIKEDSNYMKILKPLFKVSLKDYYFHVFLKNSNIVSPKSRNTKK